MKKLLLFLILANCLFFSCDKLERAMKIRGFIEDKESQNITTEKNSKKSWIENNIRDLKSELEGAKPKKFMMVQKVDGGYIAFDDSAFQKVAVTGNLDHIDNGQYFNGEFINLGKTKYINKMVNRNTGAMWNQDEYLNTYRHVDTKKIRDQIYEYENELRRQ